MASVAGGENRRRKTLSGDSARRRGIPGQGEFAWLKGGAGNVVNERCDQPSSRARLYEDLLLAKFTKTEQK
jgi:hypothetical protein